MRDYVPRSIRVFLVDDHDIVRRGLRDLLAVKRDITVVGDSGLVHDAIPRVIDLSPDVLVVDLMLQDGSGIEVCRAVRSAAPDVRVLMLTSAAEDEALLAAILAGASGFATKLSGTTEILDAIRHIGAGESLYDQADVGRAAARFDRIAESGPDGVRADVLHLMFEGRTDREITEELGLEPEETDAAVGRIVELATGPLPRSRF